MILLAATLVGCNCNNPNSKTTKNVIMANGEELSTRGYDCRFNVLYDASGTLQVDVEGDPITCEEVTLRKNEMGEWNEE